MLAALLALLAALQGPHTSRHEARLLPLPREEGVFHFLIFGDRTGGPKEGIRVLEQAVADANLLGPDLVMTVGDLVQGYNSSAAWLDEMREFRGVMEKLRCPWFPVAGNHDVYWRAKPDRTEQRPAGEHEASYEKHFGPLWYWFAHKNAAFFVLYSDEGDPGDGSKGIEEPRHQQMSEEQLAWLGDSLAKVKDKDHVFVFLHHPRWIDARYPKNNWPRAHALLAAAGNVTAVFAGHIHRMHYAGKRDGIEYFALATTGGSLDADLPGGGFLHHMNLVTVRKERITVATLPVGAVVDPRTFTPEHLADIDALRRLGPAVAEPIALDAQASCLTTWTVELRNPAKHAIEITAELAAGDRHWTFAPDHRHLRLGPGESQRLEFACGRPAQGFLHLAAPQLELSVDYLGDGRRVTLPPRRHDLALRLAALPPDSLAPDAHGALSLDGKGDCLRLDSAQLDLPDGPLTIEAWLLPDDLAGRRALLAKTESSELALFVSDGQPRFSIHLAGRYVEALGAKGQLATGRWQHLAGVFDGQEVRLYLDGVRIAAVRGAGQRTRNGHPLFVGADPRGSEPTSFFAGRIDEVRVSTTARYAGDRFEPAYRHEPDAATVLLLHLDRDLGPFAPDHSPKAAHAVRMGEARCTTMLAGERKL